MIHEEDYVFVYSDWRLHHYGQQLMYCFFPSKEKSALHFNVVEVSCHF
jgi:hypothetical protein